MTIPNMPEQLVKAANGVDPRGWLAWAAPLPDPLQAAEDSTAVADKDRRRLLSPRGHERDATSAERMLLEHLGHGPLPDELITKVSWPSHSCRRRTWPQLEEEL
jgi:hypothetical protein